MKNKRQENILWKYLLLMQRRLPLFMIAVIGMTVFTALFDVIGSYLMKTVFDMAGKDNISSIWPAIAGNVALGIMFELMFLIFMNMYNNEAKRGALEIKKKVLSKAMRLPMEYYDTHHSGDLLARLIYDADTANGIYTSRLRRVVAPVITVTVYVGAMLMLNFQMTLCLLALNGILLFINTSLSKPMKKVGRELSQKNAYMTEKLSNMIAGVETSKIYDTESTTTAQYVAANEEYVHSQKKKMILGGILESLNVGFDLLCALMFLVVGIFFINHHMTTIGNVAAIYTLYGTLSARFLQLGRYYPELINCIAYAERIFEFLEQEEETDYAKAECVKSDDIKENTNAVEIDNLVFSYDENHLVLKEASFAIPAGKNVALTGKSGCGKSTLAKLLLGFYKLDSGDIRFFGHSIKDIGIRNARKLIAYVPQEPYLFEASIRENIRYGRCEATEKEIIEAAKLANAHDFILRQKDGYDTQVSSRGQSLSGGERQRVAIARAILKNAPIMLFDEATSALDNESEQLITEAVDKLKKSRTIITIAHRSATIELADMEIGM